MCLERYLHLSGREAGGTRGQTRMGPLISCFMYDVWHAFEYLHVSEGDANKEEKKRKEVQRSAFPLSTKSLCKQLGMMQFKNLTGNTRSEYQRLIRARPQPQKVQMRMLVENQ